MKIIKTNIYLMMKKRTLICVMGMMMVICGMVLGACSSPVPPSQEGSEGDSTIVPKDSVTADTLPSDGAYRRVSLLGSITKAQPMTGLVLWPEQAEELPEYKDAIALEFSYCLPCKVVKGKEGTMATASQEGAGKVLYDWSSFDALLEDVASRGHQAIVRFRYEYPSSKEVDGVKGSTAVPDYIKALEGYAETYSKNPGGDGPTYYADWRCKELEWFTLQFYTDFAARYGQDSRIAFLEVGFGHWSEYHIYGTKQNLGVNFPSKDFQKRFFLHMTEVMPIPWLVSIDAADEGYSPVVASREIMAARFGLFDDSFMHEGHEIGSGDGYNEENWLSIGQNERWKTGVCGGEISYYEYPHDQHYFLDPKGMYGVRWEDAAAKYHISFMIANDAPEGAVANAQRFKDGSLACGYRFRILDCQTSGDSTRILLTNLGVAPIYRAAYLCLEGQETQAEGLCQAGENNLAGLLPGETRIITLPGDASQLRPQIVSKYILPSQQIEYEAEVQAE